MRSDGTAAVAKHRLSAKCGEWSVPSGPGVLPMVADGGKEVVGAARHFEGFCVGIHGADTGFASLGVGPCIVSRGREFVPVYIREGESREDVGLVSAPSTWPYGRSAPVPRSSEEAAESRSPTTSIGMSDAGVLIGDLGHCCRQLGARELFVVRLR